MSGAGLASLLNSAKPVAPPPAPSVAPETSQPATDALRNAAQVAPGALPSVTDLPPLPKAGIQLVKLVLGFIAGAGILLIGLIGLEEFGHTDDTRVVAAQILSGLAGHPPLMSDTAQVENFQKSVDEVKSLLATIGSAQQDTRDFMMKVAQLMLVTVLLPVLTALLGYIFGTQQAGSGGKPPGSTGG